MPVQATYTGDGTTDTYAVPFPYILKTHVSVTVAGSVASFVWPSTGSVRISPAPASGASVVVKRTTPTDTLLSTFPAGPLRGADLTKALNQLLYALQELT